MEVKWIEQGRNETIGYVYDPWDICNFTYRITDDKNDDIFNITASCCQLAFWCNCPCDSCVTVEFDIKSPKSEYTLGKMVKRGPGCCVESGSIAYNNFMIDFPTIANFKDRALFLCGAIFIDYMQFDETWGQKKR